MDAARPPANPSAAARPTRRALLAGALALPTLSACGGAAQPGGDATAVRTRAASSARASTATSRPTTSTPASTPSTPTSSGPAPVQRGSFASRAMGRTVRYQICRSPGAGSGPLPLIVGLHGFGGDERMVMDLGVPDILATRARAGSTPVAFATVDGGSRSYFHPRRDGTDAARMVAQELPAHLQRSGADTRRLAYYGLSMGGYGALHLATLAPGGVRAVAVSSPALWTSSDQAPAAAFDSAGDYARNSVWGSAEVWRQVPLAVSCGMADPFYVATKAFVAQMDPARVTFDAGGHSTAYWSAHLPAQIDFLAERL